MNELTLRPDRLERLHAICLALHGATEKEAWGDPTWRGQAELVAADPRLCFVPPHVGHKGWIGVWLDGGRIPWSQVRALIEESHALVAARRGRR